MITKRKEFSASEKRKSDEIKHRDIDSIRKKFEREEDSMASPRGRRRKLSIPQLINQAKTRKQSIYGNKLEVIDHHNTKSHIAFLRRVSINPTETMYPIAVILPNGVKQVIAVPSNAKLKDVLEEVREDLPLGIAAYAFHDAKANKPISITSPSVSFVGGELKIVKQQTKSNNYEEQDKDRRLQIVKDLCTSEKLFLNRLKHASTTYEVPLKSWGIDEAESCLLFDGINRVKTASHNIINKLEDLISTWLPEESCIADIFEESFWELCEDYFTYYELAKRTLKQKREADPAFTSFIKMQKSASGKPTLEALILAPLQRVPQYEHFMSELLVTTPTYHKDRHGVDTTVHRLQRWFERRGGELQTEEREFKIIQVQEKFPNDKLDLDVSLEEHEKLKHRRYNSPNMRHKKNLSSDIEIERKLNDDTERGGGRACPTSPTLVRRLYIQEGPVKLSSTTSTNERYFILFNDLLLVAKPKSTSNFKLKERVRVSEIWLAHCIDDVTEATVIHDRSFVIGWPTTNYVAAFNSTEEKELWFTALEKSINERREQEEPKAVIIKVYNRTNNDDVCTQQTASFSVTSKEDARSVIKTSLDQFQYQNEDPNDYQLWLSAKDHVPYPLLGHELPYSIKMNYSRSIQEQTHDENDNHYDTTSIIQQGKNCQFVLKKTKKGGNRVNLDIANAQRKWKNPIKKSPIINWAMNKKSVKAPYNQMEMLPPGKLFGNPLTQLSTEENLIPKPIQDILTQLFRKGPSTTGIFRKSALLRTAKQVRQMLDAGKEVDFEEKSAIVLATVLKEFFRSLPDSLIISELYDELAATKSISDTTSRVEQVKRILQNLPQENYDIVMKFMCALHHIQRFSERNNMNSYNLSICVSPSIMWPPVNSKLAVTDQASGSSDVVCFIIDNYVDIFSPENEYVLGAETDIQLDDGHGEDSDSGVDQVIYKSHHPSMDDDDQKNDSEKENEPPTPDFIFTPDTNRLSSAFAQSDSSIGTNDSDETKPVINKVNIPSISLVPEKISVSKSSPTTPILSRRGDALLERNKPNDVKNLSDMSDHEFGDQNEHFQRKLLKQPRNKRVLSSTTTSAELIEHKRHMSEPAPKHNDKKRHDLTKSKNENFQSRGASESAASTRLAKKSVISQPIIQHFATEYYATPNIIFNSVDRRRQPAAPSYEEHIQRTQAKHRVIKSAAVKPPLIAQAQVQRHQVESYEPLKTLTNNNSATQRDINNASNATSENTLPNQNKKTNSQEDINERFNSIVQTISDSMPVSKCHSTRISSNSPTPSCSSLTSTSSLTSSPMDTSPPRTEVVKSLEEPQMQTVNVETVNVRKVNILPTAPKPDRRKIQKLDLKVVDTSVEHTPVRYTNSLDSSVSDVTSPPISDCVFLSPSSDKENESMATSPKFNSPFSLTLKSEGKKNVESDVSDNRGQSLQLKKTLLTKAPMKLDQLRGSTSREDNGRVVTAREMRRTNRRLKSEIRNAFNEGKFVYKLPSRSETSLQGAIPSRGLRMNINGHLRGENSAVLGTQRNHLSKQTADILGASRIRYTENNNVAESRTCDHDDNKECSPQNESYV